MKKILSLFFAFMITTTVYAEKLIVTYDNNNTLYAVSRYEANNKYDVKDGHTAYIYDMDKDTKEKYEYKKDESVVPSIPNPGPELTPEPEQRPNDGYPEIYERGVDAISTFAIVKDVSKTLLNDEEVWNVEALYQGKERQFIIEEDVQITSAPDYWNEFLGMGAEVLKSGDVINIYALLSGKIWGIGFITRLENYDIVTDDIDYGYDFENLYSSNGIVKWGNTEYPISRFGKKSNERVEYQFGVICDKRERFYTITNKAGKESEMKDIIILPETIVYTCNVDRRYKVEMGTAAEIRHSYIPYSHMDDNGNIVQWDNDIDYVYALSRTVNGIATDIIMFYNID